VEENAILMIDFCSERDAVINKSPENAIFQHVIRASPPILMTTMAALLAGCRWLLAADSSELRRPLGIAIVGGHAREPGADVVYNSSGLPPNGRIRLRVARWRGSHRKAEPILGRQAIEIQPVKTLNRQFLPAALRRPTLGSSHSCITSFPYKTFAGSIRPQS